MNTWVKSSGGVLLGLAVLAALLAASLWSAGIRSENAGVMMLGFLAGGGAALLGLAGLVVLGGWVRGLGALLLLPVAPLALYAFSMGRTALRHDVAGFWLASLAAGALAMALGLAALTLLVKGRTRRARRLGGLTP
jgi:hypothetical protein